VYVNSAGGVRNPELNRRVPLTSAALTVCVAVSSVQVQRTVVPTRMVVVTPAALKPHGTTTIEAEFTVDVDVVDDVVVVDVEVVVVVREAVVDVVVVDVAAVVAAVVVIVKAAVLVMEDTVARMVVVASVETNGRRAHA
jgi:hypothetical protein